MYVEQIFENREQAETLTVPVFLPYTFPEVLIDGYMIPTLGSLHSSNGDVALAFITKDVASGQEHAEFACWISDLENILWCTDDFVTYERILSCMDYLQQKHRTRLKRV
jgi:hypothetical protein